MSKRQNFIVTGAPGGIGRAIAARLIARGARVFGLGRDAQKLARVAAELGTSFGFAAGDLSTSGGVDAALAAWRAWDDARSLTGLVNCAGVFARAAFIDTSDEAWARYFTHNLMSAVGLTRGLYAALKADGRGSVLNISSTLGSRPVSGALAYSSLKSAMTTLTAGLALEWAPDRIRVNVISPGIVDTPIHDFHRRDDEAQRKHAGELHPLGRVGTPDEVAAAAVFLLSPDSGWTTGANLVVDGGISL